ncbi:MAG TPA: DUF3035 domain-containing protein [Rhodospirillales bacterium]|jgi:hypothetical protein
MTRSSSRISSGRSRSTSPINRTATALCVLVAVALLSGCESIRKTFGGEKTGPDEFAVYSRPPLSLPPEYSLRPPAPGEKRPQDVTPKDIAATAIIGKNARLPRAPAAVGGSPGLAALLRHTGAANVDHGIRTIVDQETSVLSRQDQAFVDKLIFWVDEKPDQGTVVDAEKEQKRIQENQALGKPITDGETPQIKRKRARKGILDF